jgi:hypothetical protein
MRRILASLAAALALSLQTPAIAVEQQAIPASEAAAIARAQARGRLIYAYDRMAWLGTDDMMAKLPGAIDKVGGWLVDGPADAPDLVFYDRDEGAPHALYVAGVRGGKLAGHVVTAEIERRVSPERKALIDATRAARRVFSEADLPRCSRASYNTVVLPPASPGAPTLVYFLSPQTRNDTIPIGGHYVVEVAADGSVAKPRSFSRSCLAMPIRPPKGTQSAAMVVSHLLDPIPTEIHVFSSLVIDLPLVVVTTRNKRGWRIEHGEIRPFQLKGIDLSGASES